MRPSRAFPATVLVLACAIGCAIGCTRACAAPPDDDRRQALQAFADAYGIAALWPRMAGKIAADSMPRLRDEAVAEVAADSPTAADRARAEAKLDATLKDARPRLEAAIRAMDADAIAARTAAEIYAKYFETAELRDLAAFFGSPTGRKLAQVSPAILAEAHRRGGEPSIAGWFTDAEVAEMNAFWATPTGLKMRDKGLAIRDELHDWFIAESEPAIRSLARELAARAESDDGAAAH